jgi:TonB family protein
MTRDHERFDRGVLMSLLLHVVLASIVVLSPAIFPAFGGISWGSENAGGEGMSVQIVASISGVPLPAPAVVNDEAVANESAGFHESEPEPAVEPEPTPEGPVPEAEPVPETTASFETTPPAPPPETIPPPGPPPDESEPEAEPDVDNAVPFGEGGRPAINYGQPGGEGTGVGAIGEGAFGELYGGYVEAITRRISENWLQSTVDVNLRRAPRIYMSFDILRDGSITNVEISETSGNRSLDRSAQRAVFASSPLAPLPTGFRGRSVQVSFWFEYTKQ